MVIKIKGGNQKISEWKGKGSLDFLLLKWELISEGAERFYVICMFTFNILNQHDTKTNNLITNDLIFRLTLFLGPVY